tara:strand:+ start:77 stop:241 length:165 start_codon:yes stop_codon:yes gene_type:complete
MRKVDRKCHSVDLEGRDKKRQEFNCATGKIEIIEFFVTILAAVFEIRDFEISVK